MKAKEINGKIVTDFPAYYKHWAGGFHDQPTAVHEAEGFFEVIKPEFDNELERLGEIYFDEILKFFTYPVIELELNLETIRVQKHEQFTDIVEREMITALKIGVIEKLVLGESIPQATKDKVIALHAREVQVKQLIDSITDPKKLKKFSFDRTEIDADKAELKSARKL